MELWNYGMQHPSHPPHPPGRGCSTPWPGTYFGTLRGVGLRKTTDVLELSSVLWMLEEYYNYNLKQF